MIRVAFASDDCQFVNQHFGAAEQFVLYDVVPGAAQLVGVGRFIKARMKGAHAEKNPDDPPAPPEGEERMSEDKVIAKIEFLRSCAGVYAAKVGTSSIKRLMEADIQPISVGKGFPIEDLLNEVSLALACGGLSWVERAQANPKPLDLPTDVLESDVQGSGINNLFTSIDEIA
jgi:nitrogen fixation protein NifX